MKVAKQKVVKRLKFESDESETAEGTDDGKTVLKEQVNNAGMDAGAKAFTEQIKKAGV